MAGYFLDRPHIYLHLKQEGRQEPGIELSVRRVEHENVNSRHFDQNTGSWSLFLHSLCSNRWQADCQRALRGNQVVLFLVQHRKGKVPTCLYQRDCLQSPGDHCSALVAGATSHTGEQDDRGLHLLPALSLMKEHCFCLAHLKFGHHDLMSKQCWLLVC